MLNGSKENEGGEQSRMSGSEAPTTLVVWRCSAHADKWMISLDHSAIAGVRLTPFRCCGHWTRVMSFPMNVQYLHGMVNAGENEIDLLEREAKG